MIELTPEQWQDLRSPNQRVRDPDTGVEYVLLEADVYESMIRRLLDAKDDDLDLFLPLVNDLLAEDDMHDPLLDSYEKYRKES